MTGPRTTICIVPRERFSVAVSSLTRLVAELEPPFRIVYVDGGSPPPVRDVLAELAVAHDFTLLRTDHYLAPNEARNLAFRRVRTEFVAFLDNDAFLTPGWLPALEAAADQHGAVVVAPVYGLSHGDLAKTGVHLAGAENHIVVENGRRFHHMRHDHEGADPAVLRPQLQPMQTEQAEFHCFFVRSDAVRAIGGFDEDLLSLNEHLDASMRIREQGGEIWLEPAVMATYYVPRLALSDQSYYLLRWSRKWNVASVKRFHAVWDIDAEDPESARLLEHADYKRYRAYRPYRSLMGRINAWRGEPNTRPLPDRVLAPLLVARHDRRRAYAQPPVVTHRATWDAESPNRARRTHA